VTVLEMGEFALFVLKGSFWQAETTQMDVDLPCRIKNCHKKKKKTAWKEVSCFPERTFKIDSKFQRVFSSVCLG